MADEHHLDLPADLDALLRETMAAEPSAGFLPRVRERIAAQPRSHIWWRVAAAGGAAAAATLALVMWGTSTPAPVVEPTAPSVASGLPGVHAEPRLAVEPIVESGSADRATPRAPSRRRAVARRSVTTAAPTDMPVVIVDPRQRAALASMMRLAEEGKLAEESFATTTPLPEGAIQDQVIPVRVTPVEVSAIPVGGVLQFGTEK